MSKHRVSIFVYPIFDGIYKLKNQHAGVVELEDTTDLGSVAKCVKVRVLSPAPYGELSIVGTAAGC